MVIVSMLAAVWELMPFAGHVVILIVITLLAVMVLADYIGFENESQEVS